MIRCHPVDSEVEALPTPHGRVDGSPAQFGTRDVENIEDAYKPIVHSQSEHSVTAANEEVNESSNAPVTSAKPTPQMSTSWEKKDLKENPKAMETRLSPQRTADDGGDVAEEPRWRSKRAATSDRNLLWFRGVIPYEIDPILTGQTRTYILKAMRKWENETCLNFVERESRHRSYIIFTVMSCGTSVERFTVNTDNGDGDDDDDDDGGGGGGGGGGDGSNDKDDDEEEEGEEEEEEEEEGGRGWRKSNSFVKIIWENILPGEMFAFDKKSSWEINSFDDPYDYQSIMHYGRNTFAKPGRSETVTPTDPNAIIGQRKKLSPSDVRQTNKLYNCPSCGRTLMQSSGTFSFPQMDSPLAGRSYQSDQPTEFELDTLNDADSSSSSSNRRTSGLDIHHSVSAGPKSDSTVPEVNTRRRKIKSPQYSSTDSLQVEEADLVSPETNMMIQRTKRSFLPQRPKVSSSSPRVRYCRWRIVADSNEHIKIRFTHMDMILPENSSQSGRRPKSDKQSLVNNPDAYHECRAEYVEVHDGYYGNSVLLGRYCGTSIPPLLLSTRSRVWIEYRRPAVSSGSGFVAEYEVDFVDDATPVDSEVEALPTPHGRVDGSPAQFRTRDVENIEDAYKPIVHSQSEHSVTATNEEVNESSNAPVTSAKPTPQMSTSWEKKDLKENPKAMETRLSPQRTADDGGDVAEEPRWRSKRAATSDRNLLWFGGVIPYEIDPILTGESLYSSVSFPAHLNTY
ncbi:Bone morphoproteintic protein 1 [Sparganum proliferum]